jgi:hypothetical protein
VNVKHFRVFGRKFYIKREEDRMGKFDSRVDKGILVGYSRKRKAYKLFNLMLKKIVESVNVTIDESNGGKKKEASKEPEEEVHEEENLKEEEVDEESDEEEKKPKAEQEQQDTQVPPKTPSK